MTIRILDRDMVNRIAAGEVIERPASVVKELVENALDAGASRITVETAGGGTALIRVTDDGSGIPVGELETAFQRHATSKIASLDDLYAIGSLGFRGEALPSIAAVSKIEVVTAAEGETGSYLLLEEGNAGESGSRGRARGTTVTVRDLLRNVPARLKFLKSTSTENSHIANIVTQYALAYPEVSFTLTVDGRTNLRTPGTGRLNDAVFEIYGAETSAAMIPLSNDEGEWQNHAGLKVDGLVGAPSVSRANRNFMSFFVNRRWINSRLLTYAVEEAYHGLMMVGKHPMAVINIAISPKEVDVNIHPTKTEVKFRDDRPVFAAVQKAVRQAILNRSPVPSIEEIRPVYGAPVNRPAGLFTTLPLPRNETLRSEPVWFAGTQPTPSMSLPALRLVGQIAGTYIIAEGPEGLYIIDQHAAHERVLYDGIQQGSLARSVDVQGLLEPVTLEVSPGQDSALSVWYNELSEFGFTIEPFGDRTYLVRAVPAVLGGIDWQAALKELFDAAEEGREFDWREKVQESIACHGAVKAGQVLSDQEMRELLRQLEKTALPNTCPHGRPTIIRLTTAQLEREFKRT